MLLQLLKLPPLSRVLYSKASATFEIAIATHRVCVILQYELPEIILLHDGVEVIL